jgi:Bacterial regulatory proteins, luxR family
MGRLLADTAADTGLLAVVDDLHWIDDATARVLGFVARRIESEPIALLAAEGLTNREIAQRLYLSHRIVSSHLYRIFPKLGITSRAQLRSVMTPVDARPAAVA